MDRQSLLALLYPSFYIQSEDIRTEWLIIFEAWFSMVFVILFALVFPIAMMFLTVWHPKHRSLKKNTTQARAFEGTQCFSGTRTLKTYNIFLAQLIFRDQSADFPHRQFRRSIMNLNSKEQSEFLLLTGKISEVNGSHPFNTNQPKNLHLKAAREKNLPSRIYSLKSKNYQLK